MGCWFICPIEHSGAHRRWLEVARNQFDRHGHKRLSEFCTATHAVLAADAIHPHDGNVYEGPDGFVAVAGTLFYRGRFGRDALKTLLLDFEPPFARWGDIVGQFAAVVGKAGKLHVFGDYFGAFNVFESVDGRFVSTSFLSLARVLDRLSLNPQSVYEFAYTSGVLGDASLFNEIGLLGARRQLTLGAVRAEHVVAKRLAMARNSRMLSDQVREQAEQLRRLCTVVRDCFGSRVRSPLSGGYDSRLLLAALRSAGIRPQVYVYGPADSPDVTIARRVGHAEGFSVEHTDKRALRDCAGTFADHVERDFNYVDGMSVDGSVFDDGGNLAARERLQVDGTLAASGGGGEVMRNFFRLRNARFSLHDVVHAFYRQFDPRTAVRGFDRRRYDAAIESKMSAVLDGAHGVIDRQAIEELYPAFRCRANFGREISIVGRYGAYFLPFLEPSTVRLALGVPLSAKNHGRYEAHLIHALDPALSRYPTTYGSSPATPALGAIADELLTRARPIWLRKMSYRVKSRLRPHRDGHGGLLDAAHLAQVIDPVLPAMRAFFRPENFHDDGLLRRVALMEYMVGRLGAKVAAAKP